jgi:hypothetical protein
MGGVAGEEVQGVGEEVEDGAKGAFGTAGAAGQIQDQRGVTDAAEAAAEGGKGGVAESGSEEVEVVWEDADVENAGTGLGEEAGDGGAGEVGLFAGGAAVAGGDDDGGSVGELGRGGHALAMG